MEKRLFDYMETNYILDEVGIIHVYYGTKDYGKAIAEEITIIFSVEFSIAENVVKQWISNKIEDLTKLDKFWTKPDVFSYYEPKRSNRFILLFPDDFNIPPHVVSTTVRPSAHFVNGRIEWQDIEIVLRDPITPSMSEIINELFLRTGSQYTNRDFEYRIQMLGPVGDVVEDWVINGFITSIDFGNLDYTSDELMEITLTLRPNYCTLNF
jgi:hypothetical protein